jgi:hypothetical protein
MPRPLVEVRQSVLNPVVTINDPQQQVCLVGLHVKDVENKILKSVDRIADVPAGNSLYITAQFADHQAVSVSEPGTVINQDIDLGDDAYDIEGDLEVIFKKVVVAEAELTAGYSNAVDATFVSGSILLADPDLLDAYADRDLSKMSIALQPASTHFNKLVASTNSSVDFSTGILGTGNSAEVNEFLRDLAPGGSVFLYDTVNTAFRTFKVIRKTASAIYLRGIDAVSRAMLVENSSSFSVYSTAALADIIPGVSFDLNYPEVFEAAITGFSAEGSDPYARVEFDAEPNFAVDVGDKASAKGALLHTIEDADAPVSKTTDAADALVVTLTATGAEFTIHRDKFVATPSYSGAAAKKIVRADLVTSYSVANTTYSTGAVSVNANTRSSVLGASSSTNPLSLAAELALLNSGDSSISVLGLDLSPEEGATTPRSLKAAFTQALSILNRNSNIYAMVPLTQDLSIAKQFANAADSLSLPAKGKFRICLGTSPGAPSVEYLIGSATTPSTSGSYTHNTTSIIDTVNSFKRSGSAVLIGDTITLTEASTVYTGAVSGVTSSKLTITWDTNSAPTGDIAAVDAYTVTRSLLASTKIDRQIELLSADSAGVASKRLFITFPGKCTVTATTAEGGVSLAGAPGYYLTAAFSGLLARVEIHRPKNFIGLQGVTNLANWNRFTDSQLDQISDAGYLVFQQNTSSSSPFCIHQVNTFHGTQAGTQEFTELSVLANFDFVSRYFKDIVNPFAGTVNIVQSTLGIIKASLDSGIANLRSRRVSTIGAPLISGTVDFVKQSASDDGTVETQITVSLPKVLNKITIDVVSS